MDRGDLLTKSRDFTPFPYISAVSCSLAANSVKGHQCHFLLVINSGWVRGRRESSGRQLGCHAISKRQESKPALVFFIVST